MAKADTLNPRLPRGFPDRTEADILAQGRMLDTIRQTFELYGFEALETPFVEYTEALGKFLPDLDRPNEGVFSFQDDDEQDCPCWRWRRRRRCRRSRWEAGRVRRPGHRSSRSGR